MIKYDVMAEGFHTPLTREEIAAHYQYGRLRRDSPCKLAVKLEWRTVDGLFPLLKHNSFWDEESPRRLSSKAKLLIIAGCAVALFGAAASLAFYSLGASNPETAVAWEPPRPATAPSPSYRRSTRTVSPSANAPANYPRPNLFALPPPRAQAALPQLPPSVQEVDSEAQRREFERQRLAREQQQREQVANAERTRQAYERQEAERKRAAGTDTPIPLDADYPVNVGGEVVKVKIHDNDIISIDAWINGRWYRNLKKEKGMTHSGTDELPIYRNDRATLYYVWELSGKLNHCLLRVREG